MKNRKFILGIGLAVILVTGALGFSGYRYVSGPDMSDVNLANATTYRSGPFQVTVDINPEAPKVGNNQFIVRVTDTEGNPVSGASLKAYGEMAAMATMAAMRAPADLDEVEPGLYAGPLKLLMSGEWPLSLFIEKDGVGETRLGFDMATGRDGLSITAGGTPIAGAMNDSTMNDGDGDGDDMGMDMDMDQEDKGTGDAMMADDPSRVITVDSRRRQLIGVETGEAVRKQLVKTIRAVGQVDFDERRISNVSLKFDAWIGDLETDYVGARVERGQMLFTVYSPELLSAQQEYLETRQRLASRSPDDSLLKAARRRLGLWDISPAQVRALERRGEPLEYLPIFAPKAGTVVEKMVVEGSHMKTGDTLLRIADLSTVWIDAEVYEADLPLIKEGMAATVTLPYLADGRFDATVDYIYPYLQANTRTARIRLVLANPDGALKPDMYAEVSLQADLGERLVVPEEAVLVSGDSRVVFQDMGDGGKLKPVRVKTGQRVNDYIEITEGLSAGDRVITSGNFLIAAEAKLKMGIEQW